MYKLVIFQFCQNKAGVILNNLYFNLFNNWSAAMILFFKEFTGNTDRNTVVYHTLNPPIRARYIRFRPVAWKEWIAMRVELYDCLQGTKTVFISHSKKIVSKLN